MCRVRRVQYNNASRPAVKELNHVIDACIVARSSPFLSICVIGIEPLRVLKLATHAPSILCHIVYLYGHCMEERQVPSQPARDVRFASARQTTETDAYFVGCNRKDAERYAVLHRVTNGHGYSYLNSGGSEV